MKKDKLKFLGQYLQNAFFSNDLIKILLLGGFDRLEIRELGFNLKDIDRAQKQLDEDTREEQPLDTGYYKEIDSDELTLYLYTEEEKDNGKY